MTPTAAVIYFSAIAALAGFIVGWLCCEGFVWLRVAPHSEALRGA